MPDNRETPRLAYITTCKGRLAHLQQSLPQAAGQPHWEVIVVDYGCPERCGDWVEAHFPKARVVRTGPTEGFNASHARNLGAAAAGAAWLGFFDADILLSPAFSSRVTPALTPGNFYRAHPPTYQTWGSLICHRSDFERVGGYDEAYTGWGGEDDDLAACLLLLGLRRMGFPAELLSEIPHSDELRTQFLEIKDRRLQSRINRLYLQIKLDLLRLRGTGLSRQEASALFAEVQGALGAPSVRAGAAAAIQVTLPGPQQITSLPQNGLIEVAALERSLRYTLTAKGRAADPGMPQLNIECIP